MSGVTFLAKLLDGVAVEWKPLDDLIVSLKTGLNPRQNFQLNTADAEGYYVTVREIQNGKITFLDKTDRVNKKALGLINNRSNLEAGDLLFSGTGTVGRIAVVEDAPKDWNIKEGVYAIKPNLEKIHSGYLSHLLNSREIVSDYSKKIVGAPVISLPMSDLRRLKIPIPCPDNPQKSLAIQAEIVRILDTFTELTAELTAELTLRKKQYNYYRDQLLSFEDGDVEWKTLGEVSNITIGEFVRKDKQNSNAKYPVYNGGRTPTGYYEEYNNDGDKIVVSARGANAGFVNKSSTPYWAGNSCYSISVQDADKLNWMYVYYYLKQSEGRLTGIQQKGGIPAVSKKQMEDFLLPIPSLAEQSRIVAILDKFDALTHSLTEGLPREIELRQKQYEYYRDLLLSFPKPGDSVSGDKQSPGSHA